MPHILRVLELQTLSRKGSTVWKRICSLWIVTTTYDYHQGFHSALEPHGSWMVPISFLDASLQD